MSGRKEVDDQGDRGAGDRNGRGSFSATVDGDQLCFGLTVKNLDTVARSAHPPRRQAQRTARSSCRSSTRGRAIRAPPRGCVTVGDALLSAILRRPGRFYVNVHTAAFGGGAVRGQLFR